MSAPSMLAANSLGGPDSVCPGFSLNVCTSPHPTRAVNVPMTASVVNQRFLISDGVSMIAFPGCESNFVGKKYAWMSAPNIGKASQFHAGSFPYAVVRDLVATDSADRVTRGFSCFRMCRSSWKPRRIRRACGFALGKTPTRIIGRCDCRRPTALRGGSALQRSRSKASA